MKKLFLFTLPIVILTSCSKEESTDNSPIISFKDPYFLEAILDQVQFGKDYVADKNGDRQISENEAKILKFMPLGTSTIQKVYYMDEIEYFTALTELAVNDSQISSLDLSKNTALKYLTVNHNNLTALDLSKNRALVSLSCNSNPLETLILYRNNELSEYDMNAITTEYPNLEIVLAD